MLARAWAAGVWGEGPRRTSRPFSGPATAAPVICRQEDPIQQKLRAADGRGRRRARQRTSLPPGSPLPTVTAMTAPSSLLSYRDVICSSCRNVI